MSARPVPLAIPRASPGDAPNRQAGGIGSTKFVPGLRIWRDNARAARADVQIFSTTASTIPVRLGAEFQSSSKLPVTMRFSRPRVKNAAAALTAACEAGREHMRLRTAGFPGVSPRASAPRVSARPARCPQRAPDTWRWQYARRFERPCNRRQDHPYFFRSSHYHSDKLSPLR